MKSALRRESARTGHTRSECRRHCSKPSLLSVNELPLLFRTLHLPFTPSCPVNAASIVQHQPVYPYHLFPLSFSDLSPWPVPSLSFSFSFSLIPSLIAMISLLDHFIFFFLPYVLSFYFYFNFPSEFISFVLRQSMCRPASFTIWSSCFWFRCVLCKCKADVSVVPI